MDPVLAITLRTALGLLFATASLHKVRDLPRFASVVEDYEIVPRSLAYPVALAVPIAEAFASVAFVFGAPFAPALGLTLLAGYSGAIGINLARGRREIDCGCGGPGGRPIGPELLARNALLALGPLALFVPTTARSIGPVDIAAIASAVAFSALAWSAAGRLASLPLATSNERNPS